MPSSVSSRRSAPGSRSASCVSPAPFERSSSRPITAISAAASGVRTKSGTLSGSFSMAMPLIAFVARGAPRPALAAGARARARAPASAAIHLRFMPHPCPHRGARRRPRTSLSRQEVYHQGRPGRTLRIRLILARGSGKHRKEVGVHAARRVADAGRVRIAASGRVVRVAVGGCRAAPGRRRSAGRCRRSTPGDCRQHLRCWRTGSAPRQRPCSSEGIRLMSYQTQLAIDVG